MREKSVPVVTTATEAHLGLLTARNARLRPDRPRPPVPRPRPRMRHTATSHPERTGPC